MQSRMTVCIADIDESGNPNSIGVRQKYVKRAITQTLDIGTVGQNTYWAARTSNTVLDYTLTIKKQLYNNEKWCLFNGAVYEIANTAKAKSDAYINLNVVKNNDESIKTAIVKWLEDNVSNEQI